MSLKYKIIGALGGETKKELTREATLTRYKVEQIDGDTKDVEAHEYTTDGPLVKFLRYNLEDPTVISGLGISVSAETVKTVGSIKEIRELPGKKQKLIVTADVRNGEIINVRIET